MRDETVESNCGEKDGYESECPDEPRRTARTRKRAIADLLHGGNIAERLVGIDLTDGLPNGGHNCACPFLGADEEFDIRIWRLRQRYVGDRRIGEAGRGGAFAPNDTDNPDLGH